VNGYRKNEGGCLDLSKAGELGNSRAYDVIKELCQWINAGVNCAGKHRSYEKDKASFRTNEGITS
jgi:hypothetical protein